MATVNVGIVTPILKGAWDSTASYNRLNIVKASNGWLYQAKQAVPAGTALTNTDYWMLIADSNTNDVLEARIDNLATLEEGSTTGDAELMDIRVGADGVTYNSAGTAVRSQITDLKNSTDELKDSINAENLITFPYDFENNYTKNGATATINDDLSVTLNGTPTATTRLYLTHDLVLKKGTYTISGGYSSKCGVRVLLEDNTNYTATTTSVTFTISSDTTCSVDIGFSGPNTLTNAVVYPMFVRGSKAILYKQPIRKKLYDLKKFIPEFIGVEVIEGWKYGYYIPTNINIVDISNQTIDPRLRYCIIPCVENDVFIINGHGGNAGRLWCFIDNNYNVLERSSGSATAENLQLKAPYNSAYLIINSDYYNSDNDCYKIVNQQEYYCHKFDEYNSQEKVFGIRIYYNGSSERIGDAKGLHWNYKIGNDFAFSGVNDFDNIYPWCRMRRCNIVNGNIIYKGETGYAEDGTNGDVFVEIPKFYSRVISDEEKLDICLSGTPKAEFTIEPAFLDENDKEIDCIYVGAYLAEFDNSTLNSITEVNPSANLSLIQCRNTNKDIIDFATMSVLQKLMYIELGTVCSPKYFHGFSDMLYQPGAYAYETKTNTNSIKFYRIANEQTLERFSAIAIGIKLVITDDPSSPNIRTITGYSNPEIITIDSVNYMVMEIEFDGTPLSSTKDVTMLYGIQQDNGFTDNIDYHTGRTNLDSYVKNQFNNQFKYRWIEGLYGNLGTITDGLRVKNLKYYFSYKRSEYDDITKYTELPFSAPLQDQTGDMSGDKFIEKIGNSGNRTNLILPKSLTNKNNSALNVPLFTYSGDTERICVCSMAWDGRQYNNMITYRFWQRDESTNQLYGTRIIKRTL